MTISLIHSLKFCGITFDKVRRRKIREVASTTTLSGTPQLSCLYTYALKKLRKQIALYNDAVEKITIKVALDNYAVETPTTVVELPSDKYEYLKGSSHSSGGLHVRDGAKTLGTGISTIQSQEALLPLQIYCDTPANKAPCPPKDTDIGSSTSRYS